MKKRENKVKSLRESFSLTQEQLAEKIGLAAGTISKWETNAQPIGKNGLIKLACFFNVPIDYLINEDGDYLFKETNVDLSHNFVEVPLFDMATAASCGAGNGLYGVEPETTEILFVDISDIQNFDSSRKPFAIYTDGDSMTGAGIEEGSIVLINPADEVVSGNTALVVYNDNWMVKWVIYRPDGAVELRSANPNYAPIVIEKEYAQDTAWFRMVGKVLQVISKKRPRSAF